jgi:hypothetical protein
MPPGLSAKRRGQHDGFQCGAVPDQAGARKEFTDTFKKAERGFPGMRRISMIKTGDGSYCSVGEWAAFENIVAARPMMIELLNSFRDCLEDLGGNLGVTDPVSGNTVFELSGFTKPKSKSKGAKKKKLQPRR